MLCRSELEEQLEESRRAEGDNAINLALAEEIQSLQERQTELEAEAQELREQNDLLEFRILELDDGVCAHSCSSFHFKVGNVKCNMNFHCCCWWVSFVSTVVDSNYNYVSFVNIINTKGKYRIIFKQKSFLLII